MPGDTSGNGLERSHWSVDPVLQCRTLAGEGRTAWCECALREAPTLNRNLNLLANIRYVLYKKSVCVCVYLHDDVEGEVQQQVTDGDGQQV